NIFIFSSNEFHCLGDLLINHAECKLDANITEVISNYDNLRGLVEKFDIPFEHVSHVGITREEHESRVCDIIKTYQHD
ncbi:formyltetrahydrofolate deformylase, partial [Francisella tularensis subsp. holarctica]|nr:formyltetrahydrofolate deformylase [Francisella tularensis subsp. holarctica]